MDIISVPENSLQCEQCLQWGVEVQAERQQAHRFIAQEPQLTQQYPGVHQFQPR